MFILRKMLQFQVLLTICVMASASTAIADIQSLIDSTENLNGNALVETILDMADRIKTLEAKVKTLDRLEDRIMSLEKTVLLKDKKIEKMVRVIEELVTLKNKSASKFSARPTVRHDTRSLTKNRGIRQAGNVAFSTVLINDLQHLGDKQAIKISNQVLLNDGNGYEPNTGVFTAPKHGRYLFIYNFGHQGTGKAMLELVKNGIPVNRAAVEGQFGSQILQGGNAAILALAQGDNVWVETFQVPDVTIKGTFTTFSGLFLY